MNNSTRTSVKFAVDENDALVITHPGFSMARDYLGCRASQLAALTSLICNGAEVVSDLNDETRANLFWLTQMMSQEISDAINQASPFVEAAFAESVNLISRVSANQKGGNHGPK